MKKIHICAIVLLILVVGTIAIYKCSSQTKDFYQSRLVYDYQLDSLVPGRETIRSTNIVYDGKNWDEVQKQRNAIRMEIANGLQLLCTRKSKLIQTGKANTPLYAQLQTDIDDYVTLAKTKLRENMNWCGTCEYSEWSPCSCQERKQQTRTLKNGDSLCPGPFTKDSSCPPPPSYCSTKCMSNEDCASGKVCGKRYSTMPGDNVCYKQSDNPLSKTRWMLSSTQFPENKPDKKVLVFVDNGYAFFCNIHGGIKQHGQYNHPPMMSTYTSYKSINGEYYGEIITGDGQNKYDFSTKFSNTPPTLQVAHSFRISTGWQPQNTYNYYMVPFYSAWSPRPERVMKSPKSPQCEGALEGLKRAQELNDEQGIKSQTSYVDTHCYGEPSNDDRQYITVVQLPANNT